MITIKFQIREEYTEEIAQHVKNHVTNYFGQVPTFEPTSVKVYSTPVYDEAEIIEESKSKESESGKKTPKAKRKKAKPTRLLGGPQPSN